MVVTMWSLLPAGTQALDATRFQQQLCDYNIGNTPDTHGGVQDQIDSATEKNKKTGLLST